MKIEVEAKESMCKVVKPQGNGAMVLLPKKWVGKEVIIILPEK